eukprot:2417083-Prymnesium_polylepis.1
MARLNDLATRILWGLLFSFVPSLVGRPSGPGARARRAAVPRKPVACGRLGAGEGGIHLRKSV